LFLSLKATKNVARRASPGSVAGEYSVAEGDKPVPLQLSLAFSERARCVILTRRCTPGYNISRFQRPKTKSRELEVDNLTKAFCAACKPPSASRKLAHASRKLPPASRNL
jgi:hypothetical protein